MRFLRGRASPLAPAPATAHHPAMLNIASIAVGLAALLGAVVAFIPLLGWANWLLIPVALVGVALGALSGKTSGRNFNLVVLVVCILRLMLGGGIF